MLEEYQKFCLRGVEITSPIHKAAPDMCRQLIRMKQLFKQYIDAIKCGTMLIESIKEEIQ